MAVAIERDQSAAEAYVTCCWYVATLACYIAALLPPAAWIAAIPLAIVVIHLVCTIVTLPLPDQDNTSASSAGLFALLTIASSIFATQPSWARFVARLFFVVLIANAAAAVVMWLLRERVAALEARCGA